MMSKWCFGLVILWLANWLGANPLTENAASADASLSKKLDELEAGVSGSTAREIRFKEERTFPFRKKPIALDGVLRMSGGMGISIEYPDQGTVLIVDDHGVLMRQISKKGTVREKSAGPGDGAMASLLKAALDFDRTELERLFFLTWYEDDSGWSIVMTPRIESENAFELLIMNGSDQVVSRIELVFSGDKKITILPWEENVTDGFSDEELKKYFRSSRAVEP